MNKEIIVVFFAKLRPNSPRFSTGRYIVLQFKLWGQNLRHTCSLKEEINPARELILGSAWSRLELCQVWHSLIQWWGLPAPIREAVGQTMACRLSSPSPVEVKFLSSASVNQDLQSAQTHPSGCHFEKVGVIVIWMWEWKWGKGWTREGVVVV